MSYNFGLVWFGFEITRMISDQIALHSVQLPLLNDTDNIDDIPRSQFDPLNPEAQVHSAVPFTF